MNNIIIKKQNRKVKKVATGAAKDYIKYPSFVKKSEMAAAFVKKVGLPDCFIIQRYKYIIS